jgi:hypothetical protein
VNLQQSVSASGRDSSVIVVTTSEEVNCIDPFARLVVEHARRCVPALLCAHTKKWCELGRDLLHALADLPPGVSQLNSAQFLRLGEAGALLETLEIEETEFSRLADRLQVLQVHANDPDWPKGIVAIDMRPDYDALSDHSSLAQHLERIAAAGWTAILGVSHETQTNSGAPHDV